MKLVGPTKVKSTEKSARLRPLPTSAEAQSTNAAVVSLPSSVLLCDLCNNDPVMTRSEQQRSNQATWDGRNMRRRPIPSRLHSQFSLIICPSIQEGRGGSGGTDMTRAGHTKSPALYDTGYLNSIGIKRAILSHSSWPSSSTLPCHNLR